MAGWRCSQEAAGNLCSPDLGTVLRALPPSAEHPLGGVHRGTAMPCCAGLVWALSGCDMPSTGTKSALVSSVLPREIRKRGMRWRRLKSEGVIS